MSLASVESLAGQRWSDPGCQRIMVGFVERQRTNVAGKKGVTHPRCARSTSQVASHTDMEGCNIMH